MEQVSTDKLMQDMRAVVADAEELLRATSGQTGERLEKIRARIDGSLHAARHRMEQAGQAVQASASEAARGVDEQVHKNPWAAVGVGAGVGLLIGILLGRR